MATFKDVKCIIDFSLNNKYANELGETLHLPVVTSAPNVAPLGKFTISMYPDYELVNNITVAALERWNIDPVALLYDGRWEDLIIHVKMEPGRNLEA